MNCRPGGNSLAWPHTKDLLQAISAKVNGKPCCSWIGEDGAGHYIKTVHNGIGYADMQLLAEAYHMLRDIAGMNPLEISEVINLRILFLKITIPFISLFNSSRFFTAGTKMTGTGVFCTILQIFLNLKTPLVRKLFMKILSLFRYNIRCFRSFFD